MVDRSNKTQLMTDKFKILNPQNCLLGKQLYELGFKVQVLAFKPDPALRFSDYRN
jgi:hypothetical protein